MLAVQAERVEPGEVAAALAFFEPVWGQLTPKEQARVIRLLVERVSYDGKGGNISITFRPTGIKTLANEEGYHEDNAEVTE